MNREFYLTAEGIGDTPILLKKMEQDRLDTALAFCKGLIAGVVAVNCRANPLCTICEKVEEIYVVRLIINRFGLL